MKQKELEALDLLIEDLHTPHGDIRQQAKQLKCENELNYWQREVLLYLMKRHNDNS